VIYTGQSLRRESGRMVWLHSP